MTSIKREEMISIVNKTKKDPAFKNRGLRNEFAKLVAEVSKKEDFSQDGMNELIALGAVFNACGANVIMPKFNKQNVEFPAVNTTDEGWATWLFNHMFYWNYQTKQWCINWYFWAVAYGFGLLAAALYVYIKNRWGNF